jgi:hypothetical protein
MTVNSAKAMLLDAETVISLLSVLRGAINDASKRV